MKYIQITDKSVPDRTISTYKKWIFNQDISNTKKIKKFSIINHTPNKTALNFFIWTTEEYDPTSTQVLPYQFRLQPNQILELTENYSGSYDIKAFAVPRTMKFNVIIGYED